MSLQKRCLMEVFPAVREQGAGYYRQRRVSLGARERHGIAATVEDDGDRVHEVQLDWTAADSDEILFVSCDCPEIAPGLVCKHVWATMIAYDQAGFTEPVPGHRPLDLEVISPWLDAADPDLFGEDRAGPDRLDPRDSDARGPGAGRPEAGRPGEGDGRPVASEHPRWRRQLAALRAAAAAGRDPVRSRDRDRRAFYRLNVSQCRARGDLVIDLYQRTTRKDGRPGVMVELNLAKARPRSFAEAEDREILELFAALPGASLDGLRYSARRSAVTLPPVLWPTVVPRLAATGRLGWMRDRMWDPAEAQVLGWDAGPPWRLALALVPDGDEVELRRVLRRDAERRDLDEPVLLLPRGLVVFADVVARLELGDETPWLSFLGPRQAIRVPATEVETLLDELASLPSLPALETPAEWGFVELRATPRPKLVLRPRGETLETDLVFDYGGVEVPEARRARRFLDPRGRRIVRRDAEAERAARETLATLGVEPPARGGAGRLARERVAPVVETLLEAGWRIEAEERPVRASGSLKLAVASGVDWFELRGGADFDGASLSLPRLLAAVRRGDRMVRLDDGSRGMLPAEWLERVAALAALEPEEAGKAVRFLPTQALLLDALLAREQQVEVDRRFAKIRERLRAWDRVEPADAPRGFRGELRGYQREGLGWLKFLAGTGLGGCLADDMGLGKTVQVLALLQGRRLRPVPAAERRPSLVVVPKSLVHNWLEEAARFVPNLRTLEYAGTRRARLLERLDEHDLVVTTYGILRRDVDPLEAIPFDYAILDEAQAIKNPASQAARAARRLRAEHRLALTGTPVENHLGELGSIFEFLNPGLLGRRPLAVKGRSDAETIEVLGRALRPLILRRTKEEVLQDLPPKTEQTLYCELDPRDRRLYRELRDHYRTMLDRRIEEVGLERAKIHVLEALLRLRQAACHPGLIDPARADRGSAKLDTLLDQLDEVTEGGHKALVFSQFTTLLAILRRRLDARGTAYEYLDGATRDRPRRVARFQEDPACPLFLISLKAGGLGLNLTAADYVFILDPWWNPAAEAQAVDRAHRIGQTRPVFAYRLIARGTVEEKILALQEKKRELADAILEANRSVLRRLSLADLELLLS